AGERPNPRRETTDGTAHQDSHSHEALSAERRKGRATVARALPQGYAPALPSHRQAPADHRKPGRVSSEQAPGGIEPPPSPLKAGSAPFAPRGHVPTGTRIGWLLSPLNLYPDGGHGPLQFHRWAQRP